MLPPRRAALPLGTSSLGACGALLPREPRPVEGSRSSRPARRSCVPRCPQGVGGVSTEGAEGGKGGRKRAVGICRDGACRRSDESVRLRSGTRGPASGRGPPRTSGSGRGSTPWPRPGARPSSSASRRRRSGTPPGRAARGDRACRGATDLAAGRGTASRSARPPPPALIDGRAVSDMAQTAVDPNRPGVPRGPLARARASRREAPGRPDPRARVRSVVRRAGARPTTPARPADPRRRPPRPGTPGPSREPAVRGGLDGRGSPRSVSVSWAGTARRRPRPAGTP